MLQWHSRCSTGQCGRIQRVAPVARSDAETVFRLLRCLVQGLCIWGCRADLRVSDLVSAGAAGRRQILRAIAHMRREGLVSVQRPLGIVRLTPLALEQLVGSEQE